MWILPLRHPTSSPRAFEGRGPLRIDAHQVTGAESSSDRASPWPDRRRTGETAPPKSEDKESLTLGVVAATVVRHRLLRWGGAEAPTLRLPVCYQFLIGLGRLRGRQRTGLIVGGKGRAIELALVLLLSFALLVEFFLSLFKSKIAFRQGHSPSRYNRVPMGGEPLRVRPVHRST